MWLLWLVFAAHTRDRQRMIPVVFKRVELNFELAKLLRPSTPRPSIALSHEHRPDLVRARSALDGAAMATITAPLLYRETRLNLDPPYAGSTIGITLPPHSTSAFLSRPNGKRIVVEDGNTSSDETSFARRHLAANEASIFFRRKHPYPRTFLWRILDDRKVLELRSVDLTVDRHHKGEAILTLLLSFPNAIRPFGVALAEREDKDALNVFVVTTANELYTLDLHKDFFIRPAATEVDIDAWCKICSPSAFSFRYPYRIVATSALELMVSLHDGGLLRLNRTPASDGM